MENLIFSLQATLPVFFTMLLGMALKRCGFFDEDFTKKVNSFVFKVSLPVLVFKDLAGEDFYAVWDTKFVLFCFGATALSILLAALTALLVCKKADRGEFIQASYRSSAAILGIAFIQNIYGDSGMGPLMIVGSVPLYNVMAVVVLTFFGGENEKGDSKGHIVKAMKGIATNPIIWGIIIGLLWSLFKIPMPGIMQKTVNNIAVLATPLGLLAMGASFSVKEAKSGLSRAILACVLKLAGFAALFLPAAVILGFRESYLVAILIMLGAPTTVSSFIMAKNMGHKGTLTSTVVMLTTLGSAFTLTFWIWLVKSLGLI